MQPPAAVGGAQLDSPAFQLRRQPVLQAIFDNGLQQHARNERLQGLVVNRFDKLQVVAPEARHLNVQVVIDEIQFFFQLHKRLVLAQKSPQDVTELQHHAARRVRIEPDQRRYCIQRIEQKVRVDLAR